MENKTKTIGPMTLDEDGDWVLRNTPCSDHVFACKKELKALFNIPRSAKSLWITLTKNRPTHHDAVRVWLYEDAVNYFARLDNKITSTKLGGGLYRQIKDFNTACYATIHYA